MEKEPNNYIPAVSRYLIGTMEPIENEPNWYTVVTRYGVKRIYNDNGKWFCQKNEAPFDAGENEMLNLAIRKPQLFCVRSGNFSEGVTGCIIEMQKVLKVGDEFVCKDLRVKLGVTHNDFHNTINSLRRKKFIEPTGRKAEYKVIRDFNEKELV